MYIIDSTSIKIIAAYFGTVCQNIGFEMIINFILVSSMSYRAARYSRKISISSRNRVEVDTITQYDTTVHPDTICVVQSIFSNS